MESNRSKNDQRGLSSVVGTSLFIVITVLLVSISAAMVLNMTDETPPAPTSDLRLEPVNGSEYRLMMEGGDTLDGDRIRVHGIENPNILQGKELAAGDSVRVKPISEDVRITWEEQKKNGVSYSLHTFSIDLTSASSSTFSDGLVLATNSGGDILEITGNGSTVQKLTNGTDAKGIGSAGQDVTGDGKPDVPFVTSNQEIKVTNPDGEVTELLNGSDVSYDIHHDKTRVAIDSWNGSDPSVFFVNQNNDAIYRVSSPGSSVKVASVGAQSITGVGDIDNDGTDELIFGGSSQTLKYLEPDGNVKTTGVSTGSNTGIGTGTLADFDGDGQARVSVVDSSNNIQLVDDSGGTIISSGGMKKSPTAAADVDGDNDPEIVYIDSGDGKIDYIDDVGGANKEKPLKDEDGNDINGSTDSGTA